MLLHLSTILCPLIYYYILKHTPPSFSLPGSVFQALWKAIHQATSTQSPSKNSFIFKASTWLNDITPINDKISQNNITPINYTISASSVISTCMFRISNSTCPKLNSFYLPIPTFPTSSFPISFHINDTTTCPLT